MDLDTYEPVQQAELPARVHDRDALATESSSKIYGPEVMAVDRARGRLFIPISGSVSTSAQNAQGPMHPGGTVCPAVPGLTVAGGSECLVAVLVLDALTLDIVGRIPIAPPSIEGWAASPALLAMEWAPSGHDGGKLHLVVTDAINQLTIVRYSDANPRRRVAGNLTYLIQLDPATGRQDWIVRLDACRGDRAPASAAGSAPSHYALLPHNAAILHPSGPDESVFVACHSSTSLTAAIVEVPLGTDGRPDTLPLTTADPSEAIQTASPPEPQNVRRVAGPSRGQRVTSGPDKATQVLADPGSGRFLVQVLDGSPLAQVWWIFDTQQFQFTGTIGIGPFPPGNDGLNKAIAAVDPDSGRLYVLAQPMKDPRFDGGLFVADIRSDPIAQALAFSEFAGLAEGFGRVSDGSRTLAVVPDVASAATRIFVPGHSMVEPEPSHYHVVIDTGPAMRAPPAEELARRSLDLDESEGVTSSTIDGAARGYGARLLLVGGIEAAQRLGPVDPIGVYEGCKDDDAVSVPIEHPRGWCAEASGLTGQPLPSSACPPTTRDIVMAFVGPRGPAVVDGAGSRGSAEAVVVDSGTRADLHSPLSRCGPMEWEELWHTALVGQPPASEPSPPWLLSAEPAECVTNGGEANDAEGDPVTGRFAARANCGDEETSGFGYARGFNAGDLDVAESLSSFRIYRDPGRGIVARVESVARGVRLGAAFSIDTVRGVAESWANGRRQPVDAAERALGYDPNCDRERTAGTCFQRHIFGVVTPAYRCGPCGDEQAFTMALSRVLGTNGSVALRNPDAKLAAGAEDGFIAAVTKPQHERFADLSLNHDLLQTVLPTLEIIRYAPPSRLFNTGGPRGRQIIQLAGVEVSSGYGIQCLLVYDEAANTCAAATEAPGSIRVTLTDPEGKPLAGGAFELHRDIEGDGLRGLHDTLVAGGACLTTEDGQGNCAFEGIAPGGYLVSQVAAPPAYDPVPQPFAVQLAEGEQRSVTFTNATNLASIEITAIDEGGNPLAGATFAVHADPDGDGKAVADAAPAASCTTDATGQCSMRVPAASYVLVQSVASLGLEAMRPVPLALTSGGQSAAVRVVNYPVEAATLPPSNTPAPVYRDPAELASPAVSVTDLAGWNVAESNRTVTPLAPEVTLPRQLGGTVVRILRAPGDGLRLLGRHPLQGAAWAAALMLMAMAVIAVQRRVMLAGLAIGHSAIAPAPSERRRIPRPPTGPMRPSPPGRAVTRKHHVPPRLIAGASSSPVERTRARVVVATHDEALRTVLVRRIAADPRCTLQAEAGSIEELDALLSGNDDAVVVVDLTLATGLSADVCEWLESRVPAERIVGVIPPLRATEALITRGCRAGLHGLLAAPDDLVNGQLSYAVRCLAVGKRFYGPTVQTVLMERWTEGPLSGDSPLLSARESEIALLAAGGLTRTQIARTLYLSPETVKRHLRAIRAKLGVTDPHDAGQLRRRLKEAGLIDQSDVV